MLVLTIGEWYISKIDAENGDFPTKIEIDARFWKAKTYRTKKEANIVMKSIQNDIDYPFRFPIKIKEI